VEIGVRAAGGDLGSVLGIMLAPDERRWEA
jgi:hypothetical protein